MRIKTCLLLWRWDRSTELARLFKQMEFQQEVSATRSLDTNKGKKTQVRHSIVKAKASRTWASRTSWINTSTRISTWRIGPTRAQLTYSRRVPTWHPSPSSSSRCSSHHATPTATRTIYMLNKAFRVDRDLGKSSALALALAWKESSLASSVTSTRICTIRDLRTALTSTNLDVTGKRPTLPSLLE